MARAQAALNAVVLDRLEPPAQSIMLEGLDDRWLPAAREAFGGGDLGRGGGGGDESSHWVAPVVLMWRPPPDAEGPCAAALPAAEAPPGFTLGPVAPEDSKLVNETWEYVRACKLLLPELWRQRPQPPPRVVCREGRRRQECSVCCHASSIS